MSGIGVRYQGEGILRTASGAQLYLDRDFPVLPRSLVEPLSLTALRRVGKEMWERDHRIFELWIAEVSEQGFDFERVPFKDIADVRLVAYEGLSIVVSTGHTAEQGPEVRQRVGDLLKPLLRRNGARLESVDVDPADAGDEAIVATIEPAWRGKSAAEALALGDRAAALIKAMAGGELDLASSADLVRLGYASVLIDQAEGPWLDGKQAPYQLKSDKQKLEFAKDVASFANSPSGGLIVIGARTEASADGDVIRSVKEIDLSLVKVPQMLAVLRARVFPPLEGLEVRRVEHGGEKGVVMIYIPPQPAARTPFLVRGSAIEGAVRSTYLGVPERDGEDVRWTEIATLHALLQAGKLANAIGEAAAEKGLGQVG